MEIISKVDEMRLVIHIQSPEPVVFKVWVGGQDPTLWYVYTNMAGWGLQGK